MDASGPYIAFDGGFIQNPRINQVNGYMNPKGQERLTAKIYDGGVGVLFKHGRPWFLCDQDGDGILNDYERQQDPEFDDGDCESAIPTDWSLKCDIWLTTKTDTQHDVDETEERVLLNTITANTFEPWVDVIRNGVYMSDYRFVDYHPATDTLVIPIATLGDMIIPDGSLLEMVWYSDKSTEVSTNGPTFGCTVVDSLTLGNGITIPLYLDCWFDASGEEQHVYNQGVTDWCGNWGSKYVEQRFIVDMSGPMCTVVVADKLDPVGNLEVHAAFMDWGAGVDQGSMQVWVFDPEGNVVGQFQGTSGMVSGMVEGPLTRGEYKVRAYAKDLLGNPCLTEKTVLVESSVLSLVEAISYPNPFDPDQGQFATIQFNMSKQTNVEVSVKIYDFAGQYVRTLTPVADKASPGKFVWGGEADDGTKMANGAYMCRITASDGVRTQEQTLKVVLWRD